MQVKTLLADDAEALTKYTRSLLESYIEDNAMVRWCPSVPSCGYAICVNGDSHCEPECRCGPTALHMYASVLMAAMQKSTLQCPFRWSMRCVRLWVSSKHIAEALQYVM